MPEKSPNFIFFWKKSHLCQLHISTFRCRLADSLIMLKQVQKRTATSRVMAELL